jgi:hypothetical protein
LPSAGALAEGLLRSISMMDATTLEECQYEGCHCQDARIRRDDQDFCGESCARMAIEGTLADACPCGHPECDASPAGE